MLKFSVIYFCFHNCNIVMVNNWKRISYFFSPIIIMSICLFLILFDFLD